MEEVRDREAGIGPSVTTMLAVTFWKLMPEAGICPQLFTSYAWSAPA